MGSELPRHEQVREGSMNRRTFLRRLGIGVVATAALASVPVSFVQSLGLTDAAQDWALKKLHKAWIDFYRAHKTFPTEFVLGKDLWEAFEGQLTVAHRFEWRGNPGVDGKYRVLAFKGCKVRWDGPGYDIRSIA